MPTKLPPQDVMAMEAEADSSTTEMSLRDHLLAAQAISQQTSQSPSPQQHHHHHQQQPPAIPSGQQPPHANSNGTPAATSGQSGLTHQTPPHPSSHQHQHQQAQPQPMQLDHQQQQSGPPQPHHHHPQLAPQINQQIDPQISVQYGYPPQHHPSVQAHSTPQQQAAMAAMTPGGSATTGVGSPTSAASSRAKRELSSSKRAAQNRAAQRAFRQRKETYIKKLEEDVRSSAALPALQEEFQRVQNENYHMREYIMQLQSRLLDTVGEFPHPPATLELRDPRSGEPLRSAEALREAAARQEGGVHPLPPTGEGGDREQAPTAAMRGQYPNEGAEGKGAEPSAYPNIEERPERPARPGPEAVGPA